MFTLLSLVTAVKDYIEVVHKLVETNSSNEFEILSYNDLGAIVTYIVMSAKDMLWSFLTFKWLQNVTLLPFIIPNVASAMISEISVLDGYFHNAFTFLETPISYGNQNFLVYGIEKFSIGLVNSLFLFLPTSVSHIITLRRFVMQGLEAGYLAGLGTMAGNLVWIGSILFGLRFIVIPWVSLDILRYGLGTLLLVKYMWDSYSEKRSVLEDLSKKKIFFLNFLLAFTEQATIYPFVSNLSFGSDATILETFPTNSFTEYSMIHAFYLLGLFVGSLSLLQLTCWFWENPAFNIYMWAMSSLKVNNGISQRFVNFAFLYLTMLFSVANLSYFGLDYTIANPLGLVHEDRLLDQKGLLETSFLNTKASDRNTRRNRGRHGRRERWKRRVRRYRTFDASLYDQGIYDVFTMEDLNYGFDRFWLRRKIRNHRVRFRFFPGPWMRSFKKQLAKPRLESFMGPRVEFFRILFEQSYHPEFHEFRNVKQTNGELLEKQKKIKTSIVNQTNLLEEFKGNNLISYYSENNKKIPTENLIKEHSALRKFIRKVKTRTKTAEVLVQMNNADNINFQSKLGAGNTSKSIYSKRWKEIFSKVSHATNQNNSRKGFEQSFLQRFYNQTVLGTSSLKPGIANYFKGNNQMNENKRKWMKSSKENAEKQLSKKDRQILRYKTFLADGTSKPEVSLNKQKKFEGYEPMTLLHPIQFYLQKEQAFQKKMKFYGATLYRNFGIENNAPYYRIMMKKFFYYYKPTSRWERTMRTATMRKARRKGPRIPRKFNVNKQTQMLSRMEGYEGVVSQDLNANVQSLRPAVPVALGSRAKLEGSAKFDNLASEILEKNSTKLQRPTHFYSLVSKRATRYRSQIYKDVLQHWYYSPFNRFLLKFDVDAFIRRQPNSHFLTKKEESLLHLKRFLLSDYYNTLRWYSSMEHYDSMKKRIGKTKSFANNVYNQQFFGTFKKIRHLFYITPSLSDNTILKFDQPLFNEYKTSKNSISSDQILYNSSTIHEELLADSELYGNLTSVKPLPENLTTQATTILKQYLKEANPARQDYIRQLIQEENYPELTNFLFKGQKIRGTVPITNESLFLDQENTNLGKNLNEAVKFEKEKILEFLNNKIVETNLSNSSYLSRSSGLTGEGRSQIEGSPLAEKFTESLPLSDPRYGWIALMQKSRNMLYNQEALKSYVQNRVEKMEKRKKREEKAFKARLENMKKWVNLEIKPQSNYSDEKTNLSGLKTSVQKAVKEGLYYEIAGGFVSKKLEKSNLRNNRKMILQNFANYLQPNKNKLSLTDARSSSSLGYKSRAQKLKQDPHKTKNFSLELKKHLQNRVKLRALETFEAEKTLRNKLISTQQLLKEQKTASLSSNLNPSLISKLLNNTVIPFKWISSKVLSRVSSVYSSENAKNVLQPLTTVLKVFTRRKEKSFETWKKRETVLSTRKKIRRKIYRVLDQKKQSQKNYNSSELEKFMLKQSNEPSRQKSDLLNILEEQRNKKTWKFYEKMPFSTSRRESKQQSTSTSMSALDASSGKNMNEITSDSNSKIFGEIFEKKFKKKRTRSRRYRRFKGRGPIKKHTLAEKLKRQFKLLKRYGEKANEKNKKMEILEMITKRKYNPDTLFETREMKQRRTRQSKHRYWKKHKRQKYLQMKRKQRKRRRYSISKLRVLNKEFKRIKNQNEIKKWWWKTFLPKFMNTGDAVWEFEKQKQIKQELENLTSSEILARDQILNPQSKAVLQIGNKDFKPLAVPQALRLKEDLVSQGILNFGENQKNQSSDFNSVKMFSEFEHSKKSGQAFEKEKEMNNVGLNFNEAFKNDESKKSSRSTLGKIASKIPVAATKEDQDIFANFAKTLYEKTSVSEATTENLTISNTSRKFVGMNPIPFYAGWDESLRQFVVTNRLLSRQDAGYLMTLEKSETGLPLPPVDLASRTKLEAQNEILFTKAPLQGMNAATTLYWQIPFTTYDPDQFFALGMDGFSPLGWRFFNFKHSKETTKPLLVQNVFYANSENIQNQSLLSYNIQLKMLDVNLKKTQTRFAKDRFNEMSKSNRISKNQSRKIQKRQKRVKKHPRPPVWFPSGSLTNQVLPVHYIYVFYKRTRLPRDRYLGRRFRRADDSKASFIQSNFTKLTDFTLRKRVKPIRKYHRKRNVNKSLASLTDRGDTSLMIRRRPLKALLDEPVRFRPLSKTKLNTQMDFLNSGLLKRKQRKRNLNTKPNAENLRIRQLRRRVQRQVLRPVTRYKPRPGGLVWPGDYLRLEAMKAPTLKIQPNILVVPSETKGNVGRKKKRRSIQEWQIQPKKYLLQKHNLKVLKKRLQQSQNLNLSSQKLKTLHLML